MWVRERGGVQGAEGVCMFSVRVWGEDERGYLAGRHGLGRKRSCGQLTAVKSLFGRVCVFVKKGAEGRVGGLAERAVCE